MGVREGWAFCQAGHHPVGLWVLPGWRHLQDVSRGEATELTPEAQPPQLGRLLRAIALLAEAEGETEMGPQGALGDGLLSEWEVQGEKHVLLLGLLSSPEPGRMGVDTGPLSIPPVWSAPVLLRV